LDRTDAESVVRPYVEHLNQVLNGTVTDSRLIAVIDPSVDHPRFDVCRYVNNATAPLELHGTRSRLLLQQKIDVSDDYCETVTYHYRFQTDESKDSWLFRWEWFRKPPRPDYRYPLAHFHVNAWLLDGTAVSGLHFPTGRTAIEQVVWGLIAEWGVKSKTKEWQTLLGESLRGFETRRRST
jgi:hypothetical protein